MRDPTARELDALPKWARRYCDTRHKLGDVVKVQTGLALGNDQALHVYVNGTLVCSPLVPKKALADRRPAENRTGLGAKGREEQAGRRGIGPNRVRFFREQIGLTQQLLADAIGRSKWWVAELEAGRNDPGILGVMELADLLQTAPDLLFPVLAGWKPLAKRKTRRR